MQWHLYRVALCPLIPDGIWKCWFLWREENQRTRRKTLRARTRTNDKLNPHMTLGPGNKPRPHWWKATALTTAPSLLPLDLFSNFVADTNVDKIQQNPSKTFCVKYSGSTNLQSFLSSAGSSYLQLKQQ